MLWPTAIRALNADALRSRAIQASAELAPVVREDADNAALIKAQAMNEELAARAAPWFGPGAAPQGYEGWAPADDDVMAIVEIPSLGLALPVRLGTSDEVLASGVGHLPGSSLPVGGISTNCVLAGHTAFRSARLFDDIGSLQVGDAVVLRTCAGALGYRVTGTAIIEPTDAQALAIQSGRDLLTLLTCYPPRVNTQRLIVTCERTEYDAGEAAAQTGAHGEGAVSLEGGGTPGPGQAEADARAKAMPTRNPAGEAPAIGTPPQGTEGMPGWVVAGLCLVVSLASGILVALGMLVLRNRRGPAGRPTAECTPP